MGQVRCAACRWPLEIADWNQPAGTPCRRCNCLVYSAVYPAIDKSHESSTPEALREESEASCFFHQQSRAVLACDECGRFLCQLCEFQVHGRHLCPPCLTSGVSQKKIETLETRRTKHDSIALALAIIPIFIWPFTFFTGPGAIYYSVKHWDSPASLLPRSKLRFVAAILIGLIQCIGWVFLIGTIFFARRLR